MENSFVLLSSMSPKIKKRPQKIVKNVTTLLATKKYFRRSSIHENIFPSIKTENLKIVNKSSDTTSVISLSSGDDELPPSDNVFLPQKEIEEIDSPEKTSRIQQWLENVEPASHKENLTLFSQVSTIFGDGDDLKLTNEGVAAHSTFCDNATKRFDELFTKESNLYKVKQDLLDIVEISETESISKNEVELYSKKSGESLDNRKLPSKKGDGIVDSTSYETSYVFNVDISLDSSTYNSAVSSQKVQSASVKNNKSNVTPKTPSNKKANGNSEVCIKDVEEIMSSLYGQEWENKKHMILPKTEPQNRRKNIVNTTSKKKVNNRGNSEVTIEDMDSIMSPLYGPEWERKKHMILPKTEPQNSKKNRVKQVDLPTTAERKKLPTIKDRPMKKLNLDKLHQPSKSPWVDKFKHICDPDTTSDESDNNSVDNNIKCNARLDFSDCESKSNSNYRNSDKENSGWSKSMEEKVQKKINYIKVPSDKSKGKKIEKEKETRPISLSSSESNDVDESDVSSDREFDLEITRIVESRRKSIKTSTETYTFLESLSKNIPLSKVDVSIRPYRTNYAQYRDKLARKLFDLFNKEVFDNAIPADSVLHWNSRLRGTAGLCHLKKITSSTGKVERFVKISISTKVVDSPDRLRDTLIHEMCHAATWIVNQVPKAGHGSYWKAWAIKAMKTFPELPPIQRCHSYLINTKYTYRCTKCGYSIGRHSKSLDVSKKCCGICRGKFEVLINKTTKMGEAKSIPVTPKKEPTGFALFVKENYAVYKEPAKKHGDVMKILGQKFAEMKVKK